MMIAINNFIHKDAGQLAEALRQQLAQHSQCHWYALIDGAQLPDLAKQMRRTMSQVPKVCLFDGSTEDNAYEVAPHLIQFDAAAYQNRIIAYTTEKAIESEAVSWLASPLDLPTLAARLVARLDARLSENMDVLFRYYDTRILSILPKVLTAEQAEDFFSVAQGWWYPSRNGALLPNSCTFAQDDGFIAPFEFCQAQENLFLDATFPDAVLAALRDEQGDLLVGMTRGEQHALIVRQLAKANALGLDSMDDIKRYCLIALMEGEDFADRSPWSAKIVAVKNRSLTLKDIMA
jgi:hypothetical protein